MDLARYIYCCMDRHANNEKYGKHKRKVQYKNIESTSDDGTLLFFFYFGKFSSVSSIFLHFCPSKSSRTKAELRTIHIYPKDVNIKIQRYLTMEACRKTYYLIERCQSTFSTNSTNEIIVPEIPNIIWIRNSATSTNGRNRQLYIYKHILKSYPSAVMLKKQMT
jgi:hypothetical protein